MGRVTKQKGPGSLMNEEERPAGRPGLSQVEKAEVSGLRPILKSPEHHAEGQDRKIILIVSCGPRRPDSPISGTLTWASPALRDRSLESVHTHSSLGCANSTCTLLTLSGSRASLSPILCQEHLQNLTVTLDLRVPGAVAILPAPVPAGPTPACRETQASGHRFNGPVLIKAA